MQTLSSSGSLIEFKNFKYQTFAPFSIYIDCEYLTEPIEDRKKHNLLSKTRMWFSCSIFGLKHSMFNNHWFIYIGDDVFVRLLESHRMRQEVL